MDWSQGNGLFEHQHSKSEQVHVCDGFGPSPVVVG